MASERVMVVVVSGQDMDRRAELYEQFTHKLILAVAGVNRPGRRTSTPHPEHLENGAPNRPLPPGARRDHHQPRSRRCGDRWSGREGKVWSCRGEYGPRAVPMGRQPRGSRAGWAGIEPATLGLKVRTESLRRHV